MEAVPSVSSSVEKPTPNRPTSLAPRPHRICHPDKCSKLENDAICGLRPSKARLMPNIRFSHGSAKTRLSKVTEPNPSNPPRQCCSFISVLWLCAHRTSAACRLIRRRLSPLEGRCLQRPLLAAPTGGASDSPPILRFPIRSNSSLG